MKRLLMMLSVAVFAYVANGQAQQKMTFTEQVHGATALLFSQNESGGLDMKCTATAFKKVHGGYRFVSAAHCIGEDDVQRERVAKFAAQAFYLSFDESNVKHFYRAEVKAVGYQHRGDDFSVFDVQTKDEWPTVPVGSEKKEAEGNAVINVASPLGLGLQVFRGNISKLDLDRPVTFGDINWRGAVLLQMPGTNGGSSGSAVISEKQEAIVAFLVGTIGGTTITAIPASRFTEFLQRVDEAKYKWMAPSDDQ